MHIGCCFSLFLYAGLLYDSNYFGCLHVTSFAYIARNNLKITKLLLLAIIIET